MLLLEVGITSCPVFLTLPVRLTKLVNCPNLQNLILVVNSTMTKVLVPLFLYFESVDMLPCWSVCNKIFQFWKLHVSLNKTWKTVKLAALLTIMIMIMLLICCEACHFPSDCGRSTIWHKWIQYMSQSLQTMTILGRSRNCHDRSGCSRWLLHLQH